MDNSVNATRYQHLVHGAFQVESDRNMETTRMDRWPGFIDSSRPGPRRRPVLKLVRHYAMRFLERHPAHKYLPSSSLQAICPSHHLFTHQTNILLTPNNSHIHTQWLDDESEHLLPRSVLAALATTCTAQAETRSLPRRSLSVCAIPTGSGAFR